MFSAAKDLMASTAAKAWLNDRIKPYGSVRELRIDSQRNRVEFACDLKGETEPIGITIEKYQLETKEGRTFIQVLDSSATRPWLQGVMRDYLHGRRFEVPSWAAAAL